MSGDTSIEWTDKTWNPVSGCSHVSAGCKNCYAEKIANRFKGSKAFPDGFKVTLHPERLNDPYKWKTYPLRIFVNSMSDLFHEDVPYPFVLRCWLTMCGNPQQIFQVLTKRPARMLGFFKWMKDEKGLELDVQPNIWLGVSVENQATALERVPLLLQTPAAIRFLSCEPLLGPVDLTCMDQTSESDPGYNALTCGPDDEGPLQTVIDWVIVGGESGPGARPMNPDWARSIRHQCREAGTAFFMKQMGGLRDKGGALGSMPIDLRFREFPEVAHATR